ncbi:hypothetical protein [Paenibacillus alvei]|uniref:Uncharacterized protein n=1 Tax=Paenibacillus alvei TaxID=44250 RepID=A0ABT4E8Y5_PAEAL|nr:hypothetical protein [Paenibacillus alvei]EPY13620.1 hypothetical protein PAAL66ix_06308 [Paenibacillus alvei A6-6i-x]MCY9530080.1 hypothetical protein [Paenibacillus alvei]
MNVKKTVVAVMLVSALSIGVLSEAAYLPRAFAQQAKAKIEVSEDIIAKVKKAIKDAMPNSAYEIADYSRVGMPNLPDGEYIMFKLKDKRGDIVVNSQSGEIVSFSLVADLKDVPMSILTTGKNKLKELDPKMAQVEGAYRGQDTWILQGQNFASVTIDGKSGKVTKATVSYAKAPDKSKVDIARKTMKLLNGGQDVKVLNGVNLNHNPQNKEGKVLEFIDAELKICILHIGAITGKIWGAVLLREEEFFKSDDEYKQAFAQPILTSEQAIAKAAPKVKQLFGVDLKGSKVAIQLDRYTFTKQGQPTVIALVNPKGTFHTFEQQPMKGLKN